jgi:hypothetical protein
MVFDDVLAVDLAGVPECDKIVSHCNLSRAVSPINSSGFKNLKIYQVGRELRTICHIVQTQKPFPPLFVSEGHVKLTIPQDCDMAATTDCVVVSRSLPKVEEPWEVPGDMEGRAGVENVGVLQWKVRSVQNVMKRAVDLPNWLLLCLGLSFPVPCLASGSTLAFAVSAPRTVSSSDLFDVVGECLVFHPFAEDLPILLWNMHTLVVLIGDEPAPEVTV